MSLGRFLRVVNLLIGLLVVAALAGAWWFIVRPAPSANFSLSATTRIARDSRGVPRIEAASIDDVIFAQGYAAAEDRMWQMDLLRRASSGELSEVVGRSALELDTNARKLRTRRLAEYLTRTLPPADRAVLASYARGVNQYIGTHLSNLPPEFRLLQYQPRPWRVEDSVLLCLYLHRTLTTTWERELEKQRLRAAGDPAKVDYLYPLRTGLEIFPGSNAWVVSGAWSANGKPILASDPHLEWSIPATWYQVDLHAPGLHVAGVNLPGLPLVAIGHNESLAWGITSLEFDEQDLYAEQVDLRTGQYLFKGQTLQARREVDIILIKNERPAEVVNWVTHHGPLFASENGRHYTLRWTAAQGPLEFPLLAWNQARNRDELRAALRRFPGPGLNVLFADTAGNIGHQVVGRLPRRPNSNGDLPADGASGNQEWDGFIPFDDLPSPYNPPSGLLISSNQNPFPPGFPHRIAGHFSSPYRERQIDSLLHAKRSWSPADMIAVQKDVYSAFAQFIGQQAVTAASRRNATNPSVVQAVAILKSFNGQMEKGTAAPFLATLLFQHLRRHIVDRAAPKLAATYKCEMDSAVIERLLTQRPKDWFPDYDKLLVEALADAFDEAVRMQGKTPAKWDYGSYNELTISHPIARGLRWIGPYSSIGPVPMSGSSTTVKQTTRRLGPSLRFVADLSNWNNSLMNLVSGNSGHLLSFDYKDQWDAYYVGRSFPMPF